MRAQDHILTKFIDDKFLTFWISSHQRIYNWNLKKEKSKMELFNPEEEITIEHIFPQKTSYLWKQKLSENEMLMMNSKLHNLFNLSITYYNSFLINKITSKKKKIKNNLDQFYTRADVSDKLVNLLKNKITINNRTEFIEPSAGTGNFIESLKKNNIKENKILAYDIEPKADNIKKTDYLKLKIKFSKKRVIVGNPPFGKRGNLALKFLNKGLNEAPYVAMILPNIFNRYSVQKRINENAKLIYSQQIQENAFILNDREYKVKCVFQIWTNLLKSEKNLRIINPPQIRHKDFQTWIHNNTKKTEKYFNKNKYKWDFAVHRQGYYDYNKQIKNSNKLIKNRQYFFIKAKSKEVLEIINKISFEELSHKNTQILGFSTSDFVEEYKKIKRENCDQRFI